jgi:hypothetical protein
VHCGKGKIQLLKDHSTRRARFFSQRRSTREVTGNHPGTYVGAHSVLPNQTTQRHNHNLTAANFYAQSRLPPIHASSPIRVTKSDRGCGSQDLTIRTTPEYRGERSSPCASKRAQVRATPFFRVSTESDSSRQQNQKPKIKTLTSGFTTPDAQAFKVAFEYAQRNNTEIEQSTPQQPPTTTRLLAEALAMVGIAGTDVPSDGEAHEAVIYHKSGAESREVRDETGPA